MVSKSNINLAQSQTLCFSYRIALSTHEIAEKVIFELVETGYVEQDVQNIVAFPNVYGDMIIPVVTETPEMIKQIRTPEDAIAELWDLGFSERQINAFMFLRELLLKSEREREEEYRETRIQHAENKSLCCTLPFTRAVLYGRGFDWIDSKAALDDLRDRINKPLDRDQQFIASLVSKLSAAIFSLSEDTGYSLWQITTPENKQNGKPYHQIKGTSIPSFD